MDSDASGHRRRPVRSADPVGSGAESATGAGASDGPTPAVDDDVIAVMRSFAQSTLSRTFRLAGGTSLALQLAHRRSNDLDYFAIADRLDRSALIRLADTFARSFGRAEVVYADGGQVDLTVGPADRKVSFIAYPFPTSYDPVQIHGQACAGVREVAAMKAYTIGRRPAARDYVDIEAAVNVGGVPLQRVIDDARERFVMQGEAVFSERLFLQQLVDTSDVNDADDLDLLRSTWPEVQAALRDIVRTFVQSQLS